MIGDLRANWLLFRQQFQLYCTVANQETVPIERTVVLLLTIAGAPVALIYNSLDFGPPTEAIPQPERDLYIVLQTFHAHFAPTSNEAYTRCTLRC
uniref:Uncharacterized protein n=1 Tax=Rhipicephalus zambeziensis TaxID=60191 RepID=A0A224Z0I4_9ACAR